MKPRMEIETVYAHQNGGLALLRANWKLTATGPPGQPVEIHGAS